MDLTPLSNSDNRNFLLFGAAIFAFVYVGGWWMWWSLGPTEERRRWKRQIDKWSSIATAACLVAAGVAELFIVLH